MSTENAVALGPSSTQQHSDWSLYQRTPKRKFNTLLLHTRQEASGYPSPPMSTPPSPPGPALELSSSTSSETITSVVSTSVTGAPLPGLPATLPEMQFAPHHPWVQTPYLPPFQFQVHGPSTTPVSVPGIFQAGGVVTTSPNVTMGSSVSESTMVWSGRKSRGHVASACINCKKAHLSCDIERPCARCVASGKQDTCVDVQHKKRGRPRLREEGEFKVEQVMPAPTAHPPSTIASSPPSTRPIAGSRHRRTESLRSLRSQTSDSSGPSALPTPTFPAPPLTQSRFGFQSASFPNTSSFAVETPTAYLDLDFVFIRANNSFQRAMSGGQDIRGRRLDDVVSSADSESFQSIRTQLREEREARDPSYMPPIYHGEDPLQGVSDADVEQFTRGFTDRTYIWTPNQPSISQERFTVRTRLAKANVYFVVITLPPRRPTTAAQPETLPSTFSMPPATTVESFQPYGLGGTYPAHQGSYGVQSFLGGPQPYYQPLVGQLAPPRSRSEYQQLPQASQPSQQLPQTLTPRMAAAGPSTEAARFTPPSMHREIMAPTHGSRQLPPIMGVPPPRSPAGAPTSAPVGSQAQHVSSEDEEGDDERSPKKRRRVGIQDVIQR